MKTSYGRYKGNGVDEKFSKEKRAKEVTTEKYINVVIGVLYSGKETKGVCIYNVNTQKIEDFITTAEAKKRYKAGNLKTINASFNFYVSKKVLFSIGDQTMYPHIKITDKKNKEWEIEKGIVIYRTEPKNKDGEIYYNAIKIENKNTIKAGYISEENLIKYTQNGYKCNYTVTNNKVDLGDITEELEAKEAIKVMEERNAVDSIVGGEWYTINRFGNMVRKGDCPAKKWSCYVGIIGVDGFAQSNIEEVDLSGCEKVLVDAFKGCKKLKKVTFSNTLKEIQSGAFANCPELKELRIPESCEVIGEKIYTKGDVYLYRNTKTSGSFSTTVKVHYNENGKKVTDNGAILVAVDKEKDNVICYSINNVNGEIQTKKTIMDETDLILAENIINYDEKKGLLNKGDEKIIIGRAGLNYVTINKNGEIILANLGDLKNEKISNGTLISKKIEKEKDYEIIQSNGKDWMIFNLSKDNKDKIQRIGGLTKEKRYVNAMTALSNVYNAFNAAQIGALNEFYALEISKLIKNKKIEMSAKNQEIRSNYKDIEWELRGWKVGGHPDSDNKYGIERCCFGHPTTYHWVVEGINKNKEVEAILTFGSNCVCNFMGISKEDFDRIKVFETTAKFEMEYLNEKIAKQEIEKEKKKIKLIYEIKEKLEEEGKLEEIMEEITPHIKNFDKTGLLYTGSLIKEMARKMCGRCLDDYKENNYILKDGLKGLKVLEIIVKDKNKEILKKLYSNPMADLNKEILEKMNVSKRWTYETYNVKSCLMRLEYLLAFDVYKNSKTNKIIDGKEKIITENELVNKVYLQNDTKNMSRYKKKGGEYTGLVQIWQSIYENDLDTLKDINAYIEKFESVIKELSENKNGNFYEEWYSFGLKDGQNALNDKFVIDSDNYCIRCGYSEYSLKEKGLKEDKKLWGEFLEALKNPTYRPTTGNINQENNILTALEDYKKALNINELSPKKIGVIYGLSYGEGIGNVYAISNGSDMVGMIGSKKEKILIDNEICYQDIFNMGLYELKDARNMYCLVIEDEKFNEKNGLQIMNSKKTRINVSDISDFLEKHNDELVDYAKKEKEHKKANNKTLFSSFVVSIANNLIKKKNEKNALYMATNKLGRHNFVCDEFVSFKDGAVLYNAKDKSVSYNQTMENRIEIVSTSSITHEYVVSEIEGDLTQYYFYNKKIFDWKNTEEIFQKEDPNHYKYSCLTEKARTEIGKLITELEERANKLNARFPRTSICIDKDNKEKGLLCLYDKFYYCDEKIEDRESIDEKILDTIDKTEFIEIKHIEGIYSEADTYKYDWEEDYKAVLEKEYAAYLERIKEEIKEEPKTEERKEIKEEKTNSKKDEVMRIKGIDNTVYSYIAGREGFKENQIKAYVKEGKIIVLANNKDCIALNGDTWEILVKDGDNIKNYERNKAGSLIRGSKVIILEKNIELTEKNGIINITKDIEDEILTKYKEKIVDKDGITAEDKYNIVKNNINTIKEWGNAQFANTYINIVTKYEFRNLTHNQQKSIEYAYDQYKKWSEK